VQQKILLAVDRETIRASYVRNVYTWVLNNTYDIIPKEECSEVWIRTAMKDKEIKPETVKEIMKKRYGDKFCVANPLDKASMDEALSKGYNVIFGSELSKEEWANIRESVNIESSTALFGDTNLTHAKKIEPNDNQKLVAKYAQKIAKRILDIDIKVDFVENKSTPILACYGSRRLTFNVGRLNNGFFDEPICVKTLDLIIHELGHEDGWHVEYDYHQLLTKLGAELTVLALKEPDFFKVS
jgi:hypothetical protein